MKMTIPAKSEKNKRGKTIIKNDAKEKETGGKLTSQSANSSGIIKCKRAQSSRMEF